MKSRRSYQPPSSDAMLSAQNSDTALRLLFVQRSLYSTAKKYLVARLVGMFVIATAAPIVGGIRPGLAATCGAVAGAWLFIGRTYLTAHQNLEVDKAAAVQEAFDTQIFAMPEVNGRENMPSLEDIDKIVGRGTDIRHLAAIEKLRNWYPLASEQNPITAVAICQRANVSYSDSLLRKTSKIWRISIAAWTVGAATLSLILHAKFETVLLLVVLPLLPAFLDSVEFSRAYESASHIRRATADEIEEALNSETSLDASQLLVWRERIYELRRSTPLVPDVIYKLERKANERAMTNTATRLNRKIRNN